LQGINLKRKDKKPTNKKQANENKASGACSVKTLRVFANDQQLLPGSNIY
jgi:hypothetical protein